MASGGMHRILEWSWIYSLSQTLLVPGGKKSMIRHIQRVLAQLPKADRLLDVGCGPTSWLWHAGLSPVGVDFSKDYTHRFCQEGGRAITASSTDLPFCDESFDAVWSFGMFHHMEDGSARHAVKEMLRVCRSGGYVAIYDGVLPHSVWHRPLVWFLRKLDRGRNMRQQHDLEHLIGSVDAWVFERVEYSWLGYEGIFSICRKQ